MSQEETKELLSYCLEAVEDWENGFTEIFGMMNEWASAYRMIDIRGDKRPSGISKNISAETPRAVNALATSITRMQTASDPYFELRSNEANEDVLYELEKVYQKELIDMEFKRNLLKGNRGMCLFGTQVWEEPYIASPQNRPIPQYYPYKSGTAFKPLSLLQCAFRRSVYDIDDSDFFAVMHRGEKHWLRSLANMGGGIWNKEAIEAGIKERESAGEGQSKSAIEDRRQRAKYVSLNAKEHELILFHGRVSDECINSPYFQQMWAQYNRQDDPHYCDITVGILNRRHIVRFHPTPYCSWHHLFKVGHYIEFELEPYAYGVGRLGYELQKDMNRILSRVNDVELFSLYNMFLVGDNSGLKSSTMNIFPWASLPVRDVNQIKELRPQVEGILNGLKLNEVTRDDFRGVTHATTTLQAVLTGATATESSLAQSEAIRAVSLSAEVNGDAVIRAHFETMHINRIDQNPFDENFVRNVQFIPKITTDKDFRPEQIKKQLEFLSIMTGIRQMAPIDFNPMTLIKNIARNMGINPRELQEPRPQIDRMMDIMRRINGNSELKNEVAGEAAGTGDLGGNVSEAAGRPGAPTAAQASGLEVY